MKIIEIQKSRKRQQHQAYFNKNTPGNFAKHGTNPKPWVLDEMVKRPFVNVLGPSKIFQVLADLIADRNRKAKKANKHIGQEMRAFVMKTPKVSPICPENRSHARPLLPWGSSRERAWHPRGVQPEIRPAGKSVRRPRRWTSWSPQFWNNWRPSQKSTW